MICACGVQFRVDHAMVCQRGGFIIQRHNELLTENEQHKQQQQKASHYLSAKQKFLLVWNSGINFMKLLLVINF